MRVEPLLDELEELGYLERDGGDGTLWLTIEGYDLMNDAESVLLEHSRAREDGPRAGGGEGRPGSVGTAGRGACRGGGQGVGGSAGPGRVTRAQANASV